MPIPGTFDDPKKHANNDIAYTSPITITALAVSGIGGGSATVTWTTSPAASSLVRYGRAPNLDRVTAETNTNPLVTSHSVNLTSLQTGKTYLVQVVSRQGSGKDGMNNTVMDGYSVTANGSFAA